VALKIAAQNVVRTGEARISPKPKSRQEFWLIVIIGVLGVIAAAASLVVRSELKIFPANTASMSSVASPPNAPGEAFKEMPVVYKKPAALDYGKPNTFTLVIASSDLQSAQDRVARIGGELVVNQVRLGRMVRATLSGDPSEVTITLSGNASALRDVTSAANVTWTWTVTPKVLRPITLELAIYNEAKRGDSSTDIEGPAYRDSFEVNADASTRAFNWVADLDPLWKIVGGLLGVIVTVTGLYLSLKKTRKDPMDT
jgi:hypothetical protein